LTEDAIKDKTQGKSTQAVVEDNHGPWVQGYFIFFHPNPEDAPPTVL